MARRSLYRRFCTDWASRGILPTRRCGALPSMEEIQRSRLKSGLIRRSWKSRPRKTERWRLRSDRPSYMSAANSPNSQEKFWTNSESDYRRAISTIFGNYTDWWTKTQYRRRNLPVTAGMLPGDFSTTLAIGRRNVGIVGLNTSFLQLQAGNYEGHLVWDPRQLVSVCGDISDWSAKHDASLILTHQGPKWLTPDARKRRRTQE